MRTNQGIAVKLKDYAKPDYGVEEVRLDFDLHDTGTTVTANIKVKRASHTTAGKPLTFDGDELELISLSVNGKVLEQDQYKVTQTQLILHAPPRAKTFEMEVVTRLNPVENTKLMGLYKSGAVFCTQCEAEGFRRITFFPDRPDILAIYTTRMEADERTCPLLLGNGNLLESGKAEAGRHYTIWHDPHPKPSYLFAMVAGDLDSIYEDFNTASGRPVRLGIHVEKGKSKRAAYAMDALIRSMRWDEEVFSCEYDLDVFNIVAVSDFNMGAMENKGLNIFNDRYVLADAKTAADVDYANIEAIVAHEYFHNWTGNRITCRDWFQLCLKEGLTVFRDQEFSSDERSRSVKRIADVKRLKANQFPEDQGPLAHPVRPASYREINNFYTATVYEKGAEVVRMLKTVLGEKAFAKGMARYLKANDGKAATIEDWLDAFAKTSGQDLSQFSLWYSQAGTPVLEAASSYDRKSGKFTLEIEQIIRATPDMRNKKPMHIPQRIALFGKNGEELIAEKVSGAEFQDGVLHLTKRRQKIVFHSLREKPILSLNRGFTSPVEVDYRQTPTELAFLAAHESDPFARWQALQLQLEAALLSGVRAAAGGKTIVFDERLLDTIVEIARDQSLEPDFRAVLLSLPTENGIAQKLGRSINPDNILKSIQAFMGALGSALEPHRAEIITALKIKGRYTPDAEASGKRALKNALMACGVAGGGEAARRAALEQYETANNMTDRYAALVAIVHNHPRRAVREDVLSDFHRRYRNDPIVLDKWFAVQATRPGISTVKVVKTLMKHPDFSFNNPNRMRSLIGSFAMVNSSAFNAPDGSGYALVAEALSKLDKINPQVSARLLTAFRSWGLMERGRQKQAKKALDALGAETTLSNDVRDILDRTLAS